MLERIRDLVADQCLIDGVWVGTPSVRVLNPADGTEIGKVPDLGETETFAAIDAAQKAFESWRKTLAKERSAVLRRWFDLIVQHRDELALLMTLEQGKPLAEALGEVNYGASFVEYNAEEAKRLNGEIIPSPRADGRIMVLKQPIGVVGAITPWNFPLAMITRKVSPAIAAGCAVVCKPAPDTPLTALALAKLAQEAGMPNGVFNVVTGNAEAIGGALTSSPLVRMITFTGSTMVGKLLMTQCAPTVKKVALELGGNSPFIVFDDADISRAVDGVIASKYRNTGQTCVCANRILVSEGIYDAFASALKDKVSQFNVGAGTEDNVEQGPLINEAAVQKVERHVADAVERGASILTGGKRHERGGTFFEPTILTGANPTMQLAKEETFGPVAALFKFSSEEEAVSIANDTPAGLAAYFYTQDLARIWRVSEALDYGIVGVNEGVVSTEVAPFGGMKESGLGREGSHYGIEEFVEPKYVFVGGLA